MQITKSTPEGIATLTIQGQLDGTTSPQLESELTGLIQAGAPRLVLDLAQVPLVSSAALRVLLSAAKRMKKHGGHIDLCALRPEVKQVFDISALTAFFGIHPDLAAALAATQAAPAASSDRKPAEPPKVETAPTVPSPLPIAAAPVPAPAAPTEPPRHAPESDPSATLTFASVRKPSADPMVTTVFPSKLAPTEAPPKTDEPKALTPPAAAVPATPAPSPVAESPAEPRAASAPAAPSAPLRRTSSAVLNQAAGTRGDALPSQSVNIPSVPPAASPTATTSGATVRIHKNEPHAVAPSSASAAPARPRLPVAPVAAALLVLAGLVGYLLLGKGEKPRQNDRSASSSPTATARPVDTPTARPSPTATAVAVVSSPSPDASPLPSPTVAPATATPSAPPVVAQTSPSPKPVASQTPAPTPTETILSAAGAIDTNRDSPENQAIRQAVLQRIDAMPLSQADKARLYTALEQAHGLGKLVTVNFTTGHTDVAPNDVVSLDNTLHRPKLQPFLDNPAVVLVVLGFSDTKGSDKTNKELSDRRARKVVEALRGPCNVKNVIHSIGMGGQTLAGETLEKNRVVEIWAVLP